MFYHQGECIVIRSKDPDVDEIQEIVSRLLAVTDGAEVCIFILSAYLTYFICMFLILILLLCLYVSDIGFIFI